MFPSAERDIGQVYTECDPTNLEAERPVAGAVVDKVFTYEETGDVVDSGRDDCQYISTESGRDDHPTPHDLHIIPDGNLVVVRPPVIDDDEDEEYQDDGHGPYVGKEPFWLAVLPLIDAECPEIDGVRQLPVYYLEASPQSQDQ
jgi:hypothetical protein